MVLPGMKATYTEDPNRPGEKRLPGFSWLPNRVRHLFVSMLVEFVGTALFLTFAFAATQVANTPPNDIVDSPASTSTLLYISLAFGFSLLVNVWIFFRISGGLFNPAVSVALALIGAIGWMKAFLLIVAQILGGIAAAAIVSGLLPGPLAVRTTLASNVSVTRGVFIEAICTAELIFAIFMLAAEKHRATFLAPIGIGLALFIAELAAVFFTGGSLNPARSLGPDVVLGKFDGYHWIYWIGPLLGAIIAVLFYRMIKALEYETANPGADSDGRDVVYEERYTEEETQGPSRGRHVTTDGANESDFLPPFHPINRRVSELHKSSLPRYDISGTTSADTGTILLSDLPNKPSAAFRHGGDGHNSAEHRTSSLSTHSRSRSYPESRYEEASEQSYRSGPSAESGGTEYSSRLSS
ncbi:aquaporin-like protein [Bimuria novae-zelandiae CBS 107.79]|uniref:Aquaporin-like protein n=1 Tax=Bimuria novae-zelandiae CBS 107.79 TaxID=1447943 RepID=A0A6A5UKD8_9PLEO|nr:aquaporin-like protein [Bimuria novae-zelandiae CBS 107.79]